MNPIPATDADWLAEIEEALKEATFQIGQAPVDKHLSTSENLFRFAPRLCARRRGIADESAIAQIEAAVLTRFLDDFELDEEAVQCYELNFVMAYLHAHVVAGLISEHENDRIMELVCDGDLIEI